MAHRVMSFIFILTKLFGVLIFPLICQSNFSHVLFFLKKPTLFSSLPRSFKAFAFFKQRSHNTLCPSSAFCGSPTFTAKQQSVNQQLFTGYLLVIMWKWFPSFSTTHMHTYFSFVSVLLYVWPVSSQCNAKTGYLSFDQLPWKIVATFQGYPNHGNRHSRVNYWNPLCSWHGFNCCRLAVWVAKLDPVISQSKYIHGVEITGYAHPYQARHSI